MTRAGVIAAISGALLVVSLLLTWWGVPPRLLDPPQDLPAELEFTAEAAGDAEQSPAYANPYKRDAFAYFDLRDIVWLVTGIAGFALGLAALAGTRFTRPLASATAALALVSVILIALVLIWPPDYVEYSNDLFEEAGGGEVLGSDYDVPFGREIGGWIGLLGALGVGAGAGLLLRGRRS